ncbi:MAG: T9SS type A sorting domain-containing protein [Bacteroidales bacterium]|nr:T9SS type A sorting domain-containing protein [Bacteroidales bacterium]
MKKNLSLTILFISLIAWMLPVNAQTNDTAFMGPQYANDIFYSLENGTVKAEPRNNWELGFYTNTWSAGIIINDGTGMKLFTYPKGDTTAWNNVDTIGIKQWAFSYNSDTTWEDGAFNRNALGHPDYGWGIYNAINHDLVGDSIYVLQLANGSLKKIWIQRKKSIDNTYIFKYADLDNQNEVSVTLDVRPYESKLFVYYSITNQQVLDREPAKTDWDLLFSKYMGTTVNEGVRERYPVAGALSNITDTISKNSPVADDFEDWAGSEMNGNRTTIGHEWKDIDMSTYTWIIDDSLCYFIKNEKGDVYKLTFDYFSGSGSGKAGFVKKLLSLSAVNESLVQNSMRVYPNPANQLVTILFDDVKAETGFVKVYSLSGSLVIENMTASNTNQMKIDISSLKPGLYILEVVQGGKVQRQKLMVQH